MSRGYDGDPYDCFQGLKDVHQYPGPWSWRLNPFFVNVPAATMEIASDIHFSQCDCPDGYNGDPYDCSQELKDVHQCPSHGD